MNEPAPKIVWRVPMILEVTTEWGPDHARAAAETCKQPWGPRVKLHIGRPVAPGYEIDWSEMPS